MVQNFSQRNRKGGGGEVQVHVEYVSGRDAKQGRSAAAALQCNRSERLSKYPIVS
jgi:hypothetical protein